MAISRMQQPQQTQGGLGSLTDPRFDQQTMYNEGGMLEQDRVRDPQRQGYFLGKLVKKAKRAVKKVTKSPLGKAALMGAIGFGIPGTSFGGLLGRASFGGAAKGLFGNVGGIGKLLGSGGKFSTLGDLFRVGGKSGADFSIPRMLAGGLGAAAVAAPFFMGGDDEVEEEVDRQDYAAQVQRARNFYSGQGDAGAGLNFMPQKQYVMSNFYAADGGRAGYADGMLVDEDDEEEFNRSVAGSSRRLKPAFLNMGGSAGQAQAEQMLMMEYVKYKNKGGDLSFEQFVKAVMQQAAPSGAGMEQPMAMAADGGLMTKVPGYGKEPGTNQFDYPSGGVRVGKQEGGIMETEVSEEVMPLLNMGGKEKDYRNTGGFVELGRKERADDVPARLSKNEFVFTADAVRNAGGGDIDRGAEVMENLMNNLEQGGEVSEESQGLEGAQAMYDQQQMLQSRIV